jgi:hypothetical protein
LLLLDAQVNVWTLNAPGLRCDDRAAQDLASRLRRLPGFRSYAVIDTGERAVASVTVFESPEQLATARPLLAQRIVPAAAVRTGQRGAVLFRLTAWDQGQRAGPAASTTRELDGVA